MLVRRLILLYPRRLPRQITSIRLNSTLPEGSKKKHDKVAKDSNFPALEPAWSEVRAKIASANAQAKHYTGQFKNQIDKAKAAIQEANRKLAEEDRSASDSRLGFDTDVETKGRIEGLPSARERSRMQWAKKLEFYLDSLQETIFTATKALNDVTGYSSIQKLRKSIELMEKDLEKRKEEVRVAKTTFNEAIVARAESQREVNELLQRKNSWSPADLERFTHLYTDDTLNLKKEEDAKRTLQSAESQEEALSNNLYRAILTRYHEEQIWSDKIRRTSTWGTFLLMGMNIFLFLVFQLLLEPWKRRRLVGNFEDKVKKALDEQALVQNNRLNEMSDHISTTFDKKNAAPEPIVPATSRGTAEFMELSPEEPDALVPIKWKSWPEISYVFKQNFRILRNWTHGFLQKLLYIKKTNLNSTTTFTTAELYVYSALVGIAGYLTCAWI